MGISDFLKKAGTFAAEAMRDEAERKAKDSRFNPEAQDQFRQMSSAFDRMSRGEFSYSDDDEEDTE